MLSLLSVWESSPVEPRVIATFTISATIRKNHVRLFAKQITCHGYALTDVHNSTVVTRLNYKASCITKHYWHHSLQTWKPIALRRNVLKCHLTNVGMKAALHWVFSVYVDSISWMIVTRFWAIRRKLIVCGHILIWTSFFFFVLEWGKLTPEVCPSTLDTLCIKPQTHKLYTKLLKLLF
jgi:hypothetical protein